MALKKKPVTGMKDMMPAEMEVRDYVIGLIKETYKTFGFSSMETPCVEISRTYAVSRAEIMKNLFLRF